jgi:hypothetical protein
MTAYRLIEPINTIETTTNQNIHYKSSIIITNLQNILKKSISNIQTLSKIKSIFLTITLTSLLFLLYITFIQSKPIRELTEMEINALYQVTWRTRDLLVNNNVTYTLLGGSLLGAMVSYRILGSLY